MTNEEAHALFQKGEVGELIQRTLADLAAVFRDEDERQEAALYLLQHAARFDPVLGAWGAWARRAARWAILKSRMRWLGYVKLPDVVDGADRRVVASNRCACGKEAKVKGRCSGCYQKHRRGTLK